MRRCRSVTAMKQKGCCVDVKLGEVLHAIQGNVIGETPTELSIQDISTDTRSLEKAGLFFTLVGKQFDGHDFIKEAIE